MWCDVTDLNEDKCDVLSFISKKRLTIEILYNENKKQTYNMNDKRERSSKFSKFILRLDRYSIAFVYKLLHNLIYCPKLVLFPSTIILTQQTF